MGANRDRAVRPVLGKAEPPINPRKKFPNPVSPEQEARFTELMHAWQVLLGLTGWRYVKTRKRSRHMAEIFTQESEHRLVRWAMGTDWGATTIDDESLEATAVHENLHVLLHRLIEQCFEDREYTDAVRGEEHQVIAVLEKLLPLAGKYMALMAEMQKGENP